MPDETQKPATETAPTTALYEVMPGNVLHIPERCDRDTPVWQRAGGVIDMGDPVIAMLARGQAHKLRPVTDPKKVAAPLPRQIEVLRAKFTGSFVPPVKPRAAIQAKGDARVGALGIDANIPKPDVPRGARKD